MFDQDLKDIVACGDKLDKYRALLNDIHSTKTPYAIRQSFLDSAPILGLSQEDWSSTSPTMITEMSEEALKGVADTGAALLGKVTGLYAKFGPTIKSAGSMALGVHKFVQDIKNAAAQQATKISAKNAEVGVAKAVEQGAKSLANTKQIKIILIAMTAALGFVGYALTSLNSAIRQKEGLPTLSQKLSAKLRSIHWPFGDFGLSTGSDTHLGSLTMGGKAATTVEGDAGTQLGTHTTASEMNLSDLGNVPVTDPFSEADAEQNKTSLLQAIKAHPILSMGTAIAMIVGVFMLCNKVLAYIVKGGGALVKKSLAPLAGSLKVRPLA